MPNVLVTYSTNGAFERGLIEVLRDSGIDALEWSTDLGPPTAAIDLVVAGLRDLALVRAALRWPTPVLAIVDTNDPADVRSAVFSGAQSVIPLHLPAADHCRLVVESLRQNVELVPAGCLAALVARLDEPPLPIADEDRLFLTHLLTMSVEAAGREINYSRRQSQRRFKTICDRFGVANHFELIAAVSRWGLRPDPS